MLLGQSCDQLKALLQGLGQPAFRGQQVYDLLMKAARDPVARGARSVSEMHTLPQVGARATAPVLWDVLAVGCVGPG